MELRHERMSDVFEKWHIVGLPFAAAFHHFTGPDQGDPHDHPWDFTTHILSGGYIEKIYWRRGWATEAWAKPGEIYHVQAEQIHRIVDLPEGECWTLCISGAERRETRFWRFEQGRVLSRAWHEAEFS